MVVTAYSTLTTGSPSRPANWHLLGLDSDTEGFSTAKYSLTKEIMDAARTFPFQDPDLRHMALDPQLNYGGCHASGQPKSGKTVIDRAYVASKRRCHYDLVDSRRRSFGVREEYCISWALFQSILTVIRSQAL